MAANMIGIATQQPAPPPIPRHREIGEGLASHIIKMLGKRDEERPEESGDEPG
jgi:hypothetical protein